MAIIITSNCDNCGACVQACPNSAIYDAGTKWAIGEGNTVTGAYTLEDGRIVDADEKQEPLSSEIYYIVPDKCTECVGFNEKPQCAEVCPMDCCIPDELRRETTEELLAKKEKLHF